MEHAEYWAERFTALDDKMYKKSEAYARTLQRQFDRARRTLTRDLGYWYGRLAENNGISYAEAKKLLKDDELADFHMTVAEYIKHGKEDGLDPAWIKKLENASARVHISRLEQMQMDLQQTIEGLYFQYETGAEMLLESVTTTSYYHTAFEVAKGTGVGVNLHRLDTETIEKFLTTPWCQDGLAFSDRIWARKDELVDTLNTLLAQNLMTGADPQKAIDQLAERLDVDKRAAGRLIMTETAAIGSEARKQCLKDLDVEEFEIVATLDSKTSAICRRMDGQHFPMSQYKIGLNAPPFHCNCRSTTVPWFDDEFTREDETRAAREQGDTGYKQVPSNMTYKEWEKEYIYSEHEDSTKSTAEKDFTAKFDPKSEQQTAKYYSLGENESVTHTLINAQAEIIRHRGGTNYEDLAFIDENGHYKIQKKFNSEAEVEPTREMKQMLNESKPYSIISIHNHPLSTTPSISDMHLSYQRKYKYGLVECHDGTVIKYKSLIPLDEITPEKTYYGRTLLVDLKMTRLNNALHDISEDGRKEVANIINELYNMGVQIEVK